MAFENANLEDVTLSLIGIAGFSLAILLIILCAIAYLNASLWNETAPENAIAAVNATVNATVGAA